MSPSEQPGRAKNRAAEVIGRKAERKQAARTSGRHTVWFGLGMFGLVGWAVAVPTIAGALLGVWLDKTFPQAFSWTLTLIVTGLVIGCLNAWHWIKREGHGN